VGSSDIEQRLGEDLWALVQQVGVPLVAARLVTTLPTPKSDRACFRLRFADGRVLKGRRAETIGDADRIETLSRLLDGRFFPAVRVRRGRALLTEWIDGTRLRPAHCAVDVIRFVGRLHASIHRTPAPDAVVWRRSPAERRTRLAERLGELVRAGALDGAEAAFAHRLADDHAPTTVTTGLCHGDLCAENIVEDPSGRLVVVDNDSIRIDAYGYDLARTWHRWPMSARQHAVYAEGYGDSAPWRSFRDHFVHWAILVLVDAAAFRLRVGVPGVRRPVARLRGLLGGRRAGSLRPAVAG
jgi:hypothetical protein